MKLSLRPLLLLTLLAALALPSSASAKDLRKKVGVGFNNNFSSVTSVSFKLGLPTNRPTLNLQLQVLAGFALARDEDVRAFAGGRVLFPIVAEDNLNVYGGVGGGYLRKQGPIDLFRGQAVVGVEFFFFGLERLGVSAEFGLNFDIGPDELSFETTSGTAASVGVHYYFGK